MPTEKSKPEPESKAKPSEATPSEADAPPGAGGHWEEDTATGDRRWVYDDPAQDPTPKGAEET